MAEPVRPSLVAGIVLALAVLLVGSAAALDAAADPELRAAVEAVPVDPPDQGIIHCPVTAGEEETASLTVAPAADRETEVTVLRYHGDAPERDEPVALDPGEAHVVELGGGDAQQPVGVAWQGGPAVATWSVEGDFAAGAPCAPSARPTAHITGFDTTAQNAGTVHLFNPFAIDAVVRVTFGTPTGEVALVLTDNVLVPARSAITLDVNEYEPEQPELSANVEVLTGRVVAQGEITFEPTEHQPGPLGRALLPGVGAPATEWAFGSARHTDADRSWLFVHNPTDRDAAVEVRVTEPLAESDVLGREYLVPAGATGRIDLADASEAAEFGVVLESMNEVPVAATRLLAVDRDTGEEVAATAGSGAATEWAVGLPTGGRGGNLTVTNPGTEPATVSVEAGEGTPADWDGLVLEPNSRMRLDLGELGERAAAALRIRSDVPVAADVRLVDPGDEDLRLWTTAPVPAAVWEGPGTRPPVRRDSTLSTTPVLPLADPEERPPPPDDEAEPE